jgi:hypothetical protein
LDLGPEFQLELLCKAVCFKDSCLRLHLVELLDAVPIALLAPGKTAAIRSIQGKSKKKGKGLCSETIVRVRA